MDIFKVSTFIYTKETAQEVGLECNNGVVFFTPDYDIAYDKLIEELKFQKAKGPKVWFEGYGGDSLLTRCGIARAVKIEKLILKPDGSLRPCYIYQSVYFLNVDDLRMLAYM